MDGYRVSILAVGQGSGNLIELYNRGELIHLILFDYGSDDNICISVPDVLVLMEARGVTAGAEGKTDKKYYLDLLMISHQDTDHFNLMGKILNLHKNDICIGRFYSFGKFLYNVSSAYTTFYEHATAVSAVYCSFAVGSGIQNNGNIYPVYDIRFAPDTYFYFYNVYANSLYHGKGWTAGFRKNSLSAVIGFECVVDGTTIGNGIFTADTTQFTMGLINGVISNIPAHKLVHQEFITAPHHGSIATSCDRPLKYEETAVLTRFLELLNEWWIVISAGAVSGHGHPHIGFMNAARAVQAGKQTEDFDDNVYQSIADKGHYPPYDSFTWQTEHGITSLCEECYTSLSEFPSEMQTVPTKRYEIPWWKKSLNRYAHDNAGFANYCLDDGNIPPDSDKNISSKSNRSMVTALPGRRRKEENI